MSSGKVEFNVSIEKELYGHYEAEVLIVRVLLGRRFICSLRYALAYKGITKHKQDSDIYEIVRKIWDSVMYGNGEVNARLEYTCGLQDEHEP